jgi:hypothetical protein
MYPQPEQGGFVVVVDVVVVGQGVLRQLVTAVSQSALPSYPGGQQGQLDPQVFFSLVHFFSFSCHCHLHEPMQGSGVEVVV